MLLVILCSTTIPISRLAAQETNIPDQGTWTLNLKDVDIRAFIEQVSVITGKNFIIDPQVKGKVSVVGTPLMTKSAVNELFLSVLRVNGFAAIPSGSATRVVALAPQKPAGISIDAKNPSSQDIITRVLPVKSANVEEVVKMLKPLTSSLGYMEGSAYSNAVIVSDYADNVANISRSLEKLDQNGAASADVEVIPLKEAWVGNIVPLIETLSPIQLADSKSPYRLRVVADERSNSIIVRGSSKERQKIHHLVEALDQKSTNSSDIQMIPLRFADAKELANLLRGLVFETKKGANSLPPFPGESNRTAAVVQSQLNGPAAATPAALSSLFSQGPAGDNAPQSNVETQDATTQSFIQADVAQNALVVRAEPAVMSEIRSLILQMDVRRPQVLIEAAIIEITNDQSEQLGVQFVQGEAAIKGTVGQTEFSNGQISIGQIVTQLGSLSGTALAQDGASLSLGSSRFDVLIHALASTSGVNLLSTPSITTLDNSEARIVVGQNVPFRTGSYSTLNTGVSNPFTTIERQDIGITLRVLPQIHQGNLISMTIAQEVSSIAPPTADTAGAADIITNKRTIETKVLAEDGETVVLGGLMEDDTSQSIDKVPLLGDIPVIGALFRNTNSGATKRNLLIFLRPTVLFDSRQMGNATQQHYNQIYDLQLGAAKDAAVAGGTYSPPPASIVFNPPPKVLPPVLTEIQR